MDLREVLLVEERALQVALRDEGAEGADAQARDPAKAGVLLELLDLRGSEHPAIPHQDDLQETESLFELVHLRGHRFWVASVAWVDLDGYGAPCLIGEQSIQDDGKPLAVAIMSEVSEGAGLSFVVA